MESHDSFLDFFNLYGYYLVSIAFVGIAFLSKNILALVVALGETTTTLLVDWMVDYNAITVIGLQFSLYGFIIYLCKASKLIQLVYIFILATLIFDYAAWAYFETNETDLSLNIALTSYYAWFIFLPFIYGLIIKGLFAGGGGKGYAHRLRNNNNRFVYRNSQLFNFINLRYKRHTKASIERVKKT